MLKYYNHFHNKTNLLQYNFYSILFYSIKKIALNLENIAKYYEIYAKKIQMELKLNFNKNYTLNVIFDEKIKNFSGNSKLE